MLPPIIETKLYFPPVRFKLVSRPHLIKRLQAGLSGTLTLISAPAGYGKTTLLGEWRLGPGINTPFAWFSIDAADNDPARFLLYLSAALDTIQTGLLEQVQPLLYAQEIVNSEAVLIQLVNQLSKIERDFILALDDYHLIESHAIHKVLTFLIDHMPPRMHLVILTRSDPAFPLSRLRVRYQMVEIRLEHLRFSKDETAQFLNQVMGLNVSLQDVATLEARTEGWIAGLQLAALSVRGREDIQVFLSAFTGSHHYIVDYLVEEVLSLQPETVRDFLVKTSILERLSGPLCDAVLEKTKNDELLKLLDHSNLFIIPLDDEQHWYRYHHLFADLLRSRLLHSHPGIVTGLHVKASEWFDANGYFDDAIVHALEAKDFERAAWLLCRDSLQAIYTRYRAWSDLGSWLKAFPEPFLLADPWLCIAKTHIQWTSGQRDMMEPYILSAQKVLAERIEAGLVSEMSPDTAILKGEIFAFQSLLEARRNEFASSVKFARKAVQLIPKTAHNRVFALGCLYMAYQLAGDIARAAKTSSETIDAARKLDYFSMHATASYTLARLFRVQGKLYQAARTIQGALEYVEQQGQEHLFYNGILHIGMAEILYEWNSLDEMEKELETGISLCLQAGMNTLVLIGLEDRALLKHAQGDVTGAFEALEEIERNCRAMDQSTYKDTCTLFRLRWQTGQGNTSGLEEWLKGVDLRVESKISIDRFAQLAIAAEFLSALGRSDEALQILDGLVENTRAMRYSGWLIFALTLKVVAWKKEKNESRALDCLEQALALAEPEGYVRVFLNLGEPMRELLRLFQKRENGSKFVNLLLSAFEPRSAAKKLPAAGSEVLSKREVELIHLISVGRSNKEIARELFISIGTVKRHTANIFDKLDVRNRTEAVARARELGLL